MSNNYRVGPEGQGTVSGTISTATITGSGSAFDEQFQAGDAIILIDSGGNHDEYEVDAVAGPTSLTITGTLSETYTGVSYYGLRAANEFVVHNHLKIYPRSVFAPGAESVITGTGTQSWRGFPRSTWTWAGMSIAEWSALKALLTPGSYSDLCYVETRDDDDVWAVYHAAVRLPDPGNLRRWGEKYLGVDIEFILFDAV